MSSGSQHNHIIYFDGLCNLCNGFVDFVIKRDKSSKFRYAPLQGNHAREQLPNLSGKNLKSIVYLKGEHISVKSRAGLNILYDLGGLWRLTIILKIFPVFLADMVYNLIARNRYSWFGKRDTCRLPSEEEKALFLN